MTSNVAGIVILLAVFGIVASSPDGGVDCRKFVFAPLCRGVAAKRDPNPGLYEPPVYVNDESIKQFLGSLHDAIEMLEQNEENYRPRLSTTKHFTAQNFKKNFQQEPTNRFLSTLFGNRRSNSERDNLLEEDFDNL